VRLRHLLWRTMAGAARWTGREAARGRLSILIYHSVAAPDGVQEHSDVDAGTFDWQLAVLVQAFTVLPLGEAVSRLRAGSLPPRAACITFDDGYADNVTRALPLLQRHGLPATFFVASAYLDGGRMFNDAVIEALRRCRLDTLDLTTVGLGVLDLSAGEKRREAIQSVLRVLKYLPPGPREERTAAVVDAAGVRLGASLMMTSEQVADLARHGMEVGAHTHRHPILNSVPDPEAREEIREGRRRLEAIIGAPVTLFAYPNGRPGRDYSERHVAMVREAGFEAAVSTSPGPARIDSDPHQLPRFTPWDRSPERYLFRLLHSRAATRPAAAVAGSNQAAVVG